MKTVPVVPQPAEYAYSCPCESLTTDCQRSHWDVVALFPYWKYIITNWNKQNNVRNDHGKCETGTNPKIQLWSMSCAGKGGGGYFSNCDHLVRERKKELMYLHISSFVMYFKRFPLQTPCILSNFYTEYLLRYSEVTPN